MLHKESDALDQGRAVSLEEVRGIADDSKPGDKRTAILIKLAGSSTPGSRSSRGAERVLHLSDQDGAEGKRWLEELRKQWLALLPSNTRPASAAAESPQPAASAASPGGHKTSLTSGASGPPPAARAAARRRAARRPLACRPRLHRRAPSPPSLSSPPPPP
jgi:hypothetical protein